MSTGDMQQYCMRGYNPPTTWRFSMRYQFKQLNNRPQIFLDTGEKFFPNEPLPKDHLFEAGLNFSFHHNDPEKVILTPVNNWLNAIPHEFANEVFLTLIKMGRAIRLGSSDLIRENPVHIDWSVDEEGYTEVSINIASLLMDLNNSFGGDNGLLISMERFICAEIGAGRISEYISDIPAFDKSIRFSEQQMMELSAIALFSKLMVPISNTYYSSYVVNIGVVRRPWIAISAPFIENVESYCPELVMLLRQHIKEYLRRTLWASNRSIDIEAELQFCEYLWYALTFTDMYSVNYKIIDTVLDVFGGQR